MNDLQTLILTIQALLVLVGDYINHPMQLLTDAQGFGSTMSEYLKNLFQLINYK